MTRWTSAIAAAVILVVAGCGGAGGAAGPAPEPAAEITLASGAFTAEQAERGGTVFTESCGDCHERGEMRGSDFMFEWEGSSVGRLYRYVSRQMPDDAPGSLSQEAYVAVVAYMLELNGFPAGSTALSADAELLNALMIAR